MSSYTKSTDFASKDSLLSGNPLKVVKGTELDDEFNALQTAVNSKADVNSPTLTGTPSAPTASGGTNSTQIATTAFVQGEINNGTVTISTGSGLSGSGAFSMNQANSETITVSHADTSSQGSVNNSGNTFIQDITLDTFGHITGISSAAFSMPSTAGGVGTYSYVIDYSTPRSLGSSVSGSTIAPVSFYSTANRETDAQTSAGMVGSGDYLSGTWKIMSHPGDYFSDTRSYTYLALRIA